MKYQKILVALDRSSQTEVVFEKALELAKASEATLMLLHCLPLESQSVTSYADIYGRELINFSSQMQAKLEQESQQAREWLAGYCQTATLQGVPTQWDLKVGDAERTILELAIAWDTDLIVLGRRGRRGLAEVFLGSVSNYIVHHAACSVLVVQGVRITRNETPVALTEATH